MNPSSKVSNSSSAVTSHRSRRARRRGGARPLAAALAAVVLGATLGLTGIAPGGSRPARATLQEGTVVAGAPADADAGAGTGADGAGPGAGNAGTGTGAGTDGAGDSGVGAGDAGAGDAGTGAGGAAAGTVAAGASAPPATQGAPTAEAGVPATTGSVYVPITPQRVLDTRGQGFGGYYLQPQSAQAVTVTTPGVLAAAGLGDASTVRGVVLNLTATESAGPGYLTVWPAGAAWPGSSNLNLDRPGQTVPNLVTTPVTGGQVQVLASNGTHVIADVQGLYVESGASATSGRLMPLGPARAYDTREGPGPLAPGEERVVDLTVTGVPTNASAAVLTVTAVSAPGPSFWTVWPADRPRPLASSLNPERPGHTVANQVVSGTDGARVRLMGNAGGHVVVDVAGYLTGAGATPGADGLFVPVTPARLADTRQPGAPGSRPDGARPSAGETVEVPVAGRGGVPATGVAAAALNVTVTEAGGPGFVTVWAAGAPRPWTSNVNPERAGQTVAGHVVSPVGGAAVNLYTLADAHLIADVTGYWTGPTGPVGSPPGPAFTVVDAKPAQPPPTPPTRGPHAFLYRLENGQYARWNPCMPIRYAVNDDRARSGQRAMLENAVLDAEAASGIDLVYVGETSAGLDGRPPAGADAVFAFTDYAASPQLGPAVGLGGGSYRASGVVSGYALFVNEYGTTSYQQDLMLHEIGHMLGVNHVNDTSQVMYPYVLPLGTYSNGDREGLWWMGAAQGCTFTAAAYDPNGNGSPEPLLQASGAD